MKKSLHQTEELPLHQTAPAQTPDETTLNRNPTALVGDERCVYAAWTVYKLLPATLHFSLLSVEIRHNCHFMFYVDNLLMRRRKTVPSARKTNRRY